MRGLDSGEFLGTMELLSPSTTLNLQTHHIFLKVPLLYFISLWFEPKLQSSDLVADNPPLPIDPELALAVLLDEGNCNNEACASRARYQHCRKWMFWVFSLHPERAIYGTYLI